MGVQFSTPTLFYCDNPSDIKIANKCVFRERTKHIEVDCWFVKEHYLAHTIALPYIASRLYIVDFFTKFHTLQQDRFFLSRLTVFDPP